MTEENKEQLNGDFVPNIKGESSKSHQDEANEASSELREDNKAKVFTDRLLADVFSSKLLKYEADKKQSRSFFKDNNKVSKFKIGDSYKSKIRGTDGDAMYVATKMPTYAHYVKQNDEYIISRPFETTVKYKPGTGITAISFKKNIEARLKDSDLFLIKGNPIQPDHSKSGGYGYYKLTIDVVIRPNTSLSDYMKQIELLTSGIIGLDSEQKNVIRKQFKDWIEREVDFAKSTAENKGESQEQNAISDFANLAKGFAMDKDRSYDENTTDLLKKSIAEIGDVEDDSIGPKKPSFTPPLSKGPDNKGKRNSI